MGKWVNLEEFCQKQRISRSTAERRIANGEFGSHKLRGRVWVWWQEPHEAIVNELRELRSEVGALRDQLRAIGNIQTQPIRKPQNIQTRAVSPTRKRRPSAPRPHMPSAQWRDELQRRVNTAGSNKKYAKLVGISHGSISNYLRGVRQPSPEMIAKLTSMP